MIEKLISRVFYARNAAHFAHWKAKGEGSFARHVALGEFYEDVVGKLDDLVETYQGAFGLIGNIPAPDGKPSGDIVAALEADAEWIEKNHDAVCKQNRALGNLLDALSETYLRSLYKLKHLK